MIPELKKKKKRTLRLHSATYFKTMYYFENMKFPPYSIENLINFLTGPSFLTHLSCSYFEEPTKPPKSSNFCLWEKIFRICIFHRKNSWVTTLSVSPLALSSQTSVCPFKLFKEQIQNILNCTDFINYYPFPFLFPAVPLCSKFSKSS